MPGCCRCPPSSWQRGRSWSRSYLQLRAAWLSDARVSSADQRRDLDRQVARLVEHSTGVRMAPTKVVCEVGSGPNGHRSKLLRLLRDAGVGTIVAEHRDRLARFGGGVPRGGPGPFLAAHGRRVVVVEGAEVTDDLVRDMVEVLTSPPRPLRRLPPGDR